MSTKTFRNSRLLKILFLSSILLFMGGCRTKCVEGEDNYPECLGGNEPTTKTEKTELVFWNLFDTSDAFAGQIQAFQSLHPNVRVNYKKFENEDAYEKLLINEIAEGEGPDIFTIHYSWLPKHQGKIEPMPESLLVPEKFRETFFDVTSEVLIRPNDDDLEQIYGLPLFVDTLGIYFNKSIFRDGIDSSSQPGKTWEDIKEQVYQLTRKDNSIERFALSGIAMGMAENIRYAIDIFSLLLLQEGADIFDMKDDRAVFGKQEGTIEGSGKPFFPAQEALKLYTSFALGSYKNYSWNRMITGLYPQQEELGVFARGKTAMIFGYSTTKKDILAIMEGQRRSVQDTINESDIGTAPVPQFFESTESGKADGLANFYPLSVSRNSKNAELAWEFLLFLSEAESAKEYHQKTGKPTARFDLIDEQMSEKDTGVFARQVRFSKVLPVLDKNDFNIIMSEAIDSVAKSKSDVDEAVALADKRLQCLINKVKKKEVDQDCTQVQ